MANLRSVDHALIPPDSDFCGYGDLVADAFGNRLGHVGEKRAVLEKRGASIPGDDLFDRTAKVDVNEVGLLPVDDFLCRLGHARAVGSEKLNPDRSLFVLEFGVNASALVRLNDAFGGNEFGHHDVSTQFLADASEHEVSHSRHRREVKRELTVLEPGKHGENRLGVGIRPMRAADCNREFGFGQKRGDSF